MNRPTILAATLTAVLTLTACSTDTSTEPHDVEGTVVGKTHIVPGKTTSGCAAGMLFQPARPAPPAPRAPAPRPAPARPAAPAPKPKPLTRHRDTITHRDTYTHRDGTTVIYPIIVPYSHCPRVKRETWRLDVQQTAGDIVSVDVSPMVYDSCRHRDEYESDDNDCD